MFWSAWVAKGLTLIFHTSTLCQVLQQTHRKSLNLNWSTFKVLLFFRHLSITKNRKIGKVSLIKILVLLYFAWLSFSLIVDSLRVEIRFLSDVLETIEQIWFFSGCFWIKMEKLKYISWLLGGRGNFGS
jgi:ABC-type polysaccharide/polyol phosphate export permease